MNLPFGGGKIMAGNTLTKLIESEKIIYPTVYNVFQAVPQTAINGPQSAVKGA
jgi:hypothetical protein